MEMTWFPAPKSNYAGQGNMFSVITINSRAHKGGQEGLLLMDHDHMSLNTCSCNCMGRTESPQLIFRQRLTRRMRVHLVPEGAWISLWSQPRVRVLKSE